MQLLLVKENQVLWIYIFYDGNPYENSGAEEVRTRPYLYFAKKHLDAS